MTRATAGRRLAIALGMVAIVATAGERRGLAQEAPKPSAGFTMDEAVATALERNRDAIAARLEIEAAEIERVAAGVYWNPVFSASVGNLVLGRGNAQDQGLSPGLLAQPVYSVGVSEVVDVWAKRSARMHAADLGLEYRRLLVADALRDVVHAVRSAFADLVREQLEYELASHMKTRYDDTVRLSRIRARAGEISDVELRKVELEGLKYQNALLDAKLDLDLARQRVGALLGLSASTPLPGPAVIQDPPREPPAFAPLVTLALKERPDLRAARKGQGLTTALLGAAQREAYPDISLGVAYTHSEFVVSGDNPNALALTVGLPLPIFDRNQAAIARSRLDRKRNENDLVRIDLRVQQEVLEAVRRMERSDALLDVYEQGGMLERAEHQLAVAESSYKAGAISLLELLEAQRTYIETRAQYLRVQHDYRQAAIDVSHAVGGRLP